MSLPGPGTVRLKVTTTAKRAKTLATKTVKATKKGKLKLTLRLRRTPPAKLRLAITFTPKGGKPATKKLSLRR